jgi:hypothetical protein
MTNDVVRQAVPGLIVEHLAHQRAALTPSLSSGRNVYAARTISPSACQCTPAARLGSVCGPPIEFGAYTGSVALRIRIAPSLE